MAREIFKRDRIVVWSADLSMLVTRQYGGHWSMLCSGEYSQDSYVEIDVTADDAPDGWLPQEAQDRLDTWLAMPVPASDASWGERSAYGAAGPPVEVMLWDMCRKGVIEPGKYLITVWW